MTPEPFAIILRIAKDEGIELMHNRMLFVLAFCTFAGNANATIGIAVRTPTYLILGADSKVIRRSVNGNSQHTVCKIGHINKVYWIAAGLLDVPNGTFSVDEIAMKNMARREDFAKREASFAEEIFKNLATLVPIAQRDDPVFFNQRVDAKGGWSIIEITFAEVGDVTPLHKIEFHLSRIPNGGVRTTVPMEDLPDTINPSVSATFMGDYEAIRAQAANAAVGRPHDVERLIDMEIAANPAEVGPPISIVLIDKSGAHWISKGTCR